MSVPVDLAESGHGLRVVAEFAAAWATRICAPPAYPAGPSGSTWPGSLINPSRVTTGRDYSGE
ncbi:MAG TPA: hypothetical protein VF933_31735 [Streptosporangiaceae bacterium]